jgi:hypothetical protein
MLLIRNFPLHVILGRSLLTYSDSTAAGPSNTTYILLPSISIQQVDLFKLFLQMNFFLADSPLLPSVFIQRPLSGVI